MTVGHEDVFVAASEGSNSNTKCVIEHTWMDKNAHRCSLASLALGWNPLVVNERAGEKGRRVASEERPPLLHPAAVIWHHLLLQGARAYRVGQRAPGITPGYVHQPYARPAAGTTAEGKEWLQCWRWNRERLSVQADNWADTRPGQIQATEDKGGDKEVEGPLSAHEWSILMSNISVFDRRWAWKRSQKTWPASGNEGEWRVGKLINMGESSEVPASGRAEQSSSLNHWGCVWLSLTGRPTCGTKKHMKT